MIDPVTRYGGEAVVDRKACLQCGAALAGADCASCDNAGKTEALAMVMILVSIALVLGLYVFIKFI
jgi:hypothetical protein